jgi:hypothetical protein
MYKVIAMVCLVRPCACSSCRLVWPCKKMNPPSDCFKSTLSGARAADTHVDQRQLNTIRGTRSHVMPPPPYARPVTAQDRA